MASVLDDSMRSKLWSLAGGAIFLTVLTWLVAPPLAVIPFVVLTIPLGVLAASYKGHSFTRMGHCPHCDYDLIAMDFGSQGRTRCPECGGWVAKVLPTSKDNERI